MADGRRMRGERRRTEIIAATLRVVEQRGVAGVTHRTVAADADVPASSVNYHFATLDDLLVAALSTAVDEYVQQLDDIVNADDDRLGGLAQLIADAGTSGRGRALAERELTLVASRRPALRPAAARWREVVADIASHYSDDPMAGDALIGVSDAICTRLLLGDATLTPARIRQHLAYALRIE